MVTQAAIPVDGLPGIVWAWAKTMERRWAGNPFALEVLEDAFDEVKRLVADVTGEPWFEFDRLNREPRLRKDRT